MMKFINRIKNVVSFLFNIVYRHSRELLGLIGVLIVVLIVWVGFLFLVRDFQIGTTPALIMVWSSGLLIILGLFPEILGRIRKIKFKDFELELHEILENEISSPKVRMSDFVINLRVEGKGNWDDLLGILNELAIKRDSYRLLIVNLRNDDFISVSMLYIYLLFMETLGAGSVVLFVKKSGQKINLSEIRTNHVIGVTYGKSILLTLQQMFPVTRVTFRQDTFRSDAADEIGPLDPEDEIPSIGELEHMRLRLDKELRTLRNRWRNSDFPVMTKRDVEQWFQSHLSKSQIELTQKENHLDVLYKSLRNNENFLMMFDGNQLSGIGFICDISKNIAFDILRQLNVKAD